MLFGKCANPMIEKKSHKFSLAHHMKHKKNWKMYRASHT